MQFLTILEFQHGKQELLLEVLSTASFFTTALFWSSISSTGFTHKWIVLCRKNNIHFYLLKWYLKIIITCTTKNYI